MQTLSTRIFGMIEIGNSERGFVLALLLILVAGIFLFLSDRLVSGRRAFFTVTGKGGRTRRFPLGRWRGPLSAVCLGLGVRHTVVPGLRLAAACIEPTPGVCLGDYVQGKGV